MLESPLRRAFLVRGIDYSAAIAKSRHRGGQLGKSTLTRVFAPFPLIDTGIDRGDDRSYTPELGQNWW